jgi:hypothetical protein
MELYGTESPIRLALFAIRRLKEKSPGSARVISRGRPGDWYCY